MSCCLHCTGTCLVMQLAACCGMSSPHIDHLHAVLQKLLLLLASPHSIPQAAMRLQIDTSRGRLTGSSKRCSSRPISLADSSTGVRRAAVITKATGPRDAGLTKEELAELQKYLRAGPAHQNRTFFEDGESSDGFLPDEAYDEGEEDSDDRERVYLVGVEVRSGSNATASTSYSSSGGANMDGKSSTTTGVKRGSRASYTIQDSLEELGRLADTAGLKVVGSSWQSLETPNAATYIGSGKVAEVARAVKAYDVETVIFDDALSPGQLRNLEKAFSGDNGRPGVKVCDRTALILDIFSQRAATREGKLQVELAQTEYQLPRLTRMWTHLDRVTGGGQVKGAGEKQIEIDKRLLRDRASALRKELESVRTHRRAYRERRQMAPIPVVALVGYTNAGKSTLLNRLTSADVLAEDKLFATLDPTTRKIKLKGNREMLLTDTVGFIQKLPTELVAAFRATLEEIRDAGVLLHVVDISHPNAAAQCEAVLRVLDELGITDIPIVTAWNKLDCCVQPDNVRRIAARRRDTVCISGLTGEGINDLLELIGNKLAESMTEVDVTVPYSAGDLVDDIHVSGCVVEEEYGEEGVRIKARVPASVAGRLKKYLTSAEQGDVGGSSSSSAGGSGLLEGWDGLEALASGAEGDGWGMEEEQGSSSQGEQEQAVVWSTSGSRR